MLEVKPRWIWELDRVSRLIDEAKRDVEKAELRLRHLREEEETLLAYARMPKEK
jgi:hypothetical protein